MKIQLFNKELQNKIDKFERERASIEFCRNIPLEKLKRMVRENLIPKE